MFSKAKLKRFNEEVGCAPPPTKYDPRLSIGNSGVCFDKSERWKESEGPLPSIPQIGSFRKLTPSKKSTSYSSKLNSSTCSTNSENSAHGTFAAPKDNYFTRSKSFKSNRGNDKHGEEILREKVKSIELEKEQLVNDVSRLELELSELQRQVDSSNLKGLKEYSNAYTQVDSNEGIPNVTISSTSFSKDTSVEHNGTQSDGAVISLSLSEHQLLVDKVNHLTALRDNLEHCIQSKEDVITDLQMQIDLVVAEAQDSQSEVAQIRKELEQTFEERMKSESQVKDLVNKYEALSFQHKEEIAKSQNQIDIKDVEIELLNDSIATLNVQVSQHELTICKIRSEVSVRMTQISSLETTVEDLSMSSKEKEVMETVLEDEIKEKNDEISKLEESIENLQEALKEAEIEKNDALTMLEDGKRARGELLSEIVSLKVKLKEQEILQQFLENQVASREAEVAESATKLSTLEHDLGTIRQIASDLQSDAEVKLNETFSLKASLESKDHSIEEKEDTIRRLREELNENVAFIAKLESEQKKNEKTCIVMQEDNEGRRKTIAAMEEEMAVLRKSLGNAEVNMSQLQGRVVELMVEIGDREEENQNRLLSKDLDLEDVSLKYSESLLQVESLKRSLSEASDSLEREKLIANATESKLENLTKEWAKKNDQVVEMESSIMELTLKLTHLEDALTCEEAESLHLQRALEESNGNLSSLKQKYQVLQDSNAGFQARITFLRTDMQKKAVAVEESQMCIDLLREERNQLVSSFVDLQKLKEDKDVMLEDLQKEFEASLKNVTALHEKMDSLNRCLDESETQLEESRQLNKMKDCALSQLDLKYAELQNKFYEEEAHKLNFKRKVKELEEQLSILREERDITEDRLKNEVKEQRDQIDELKAQLTDNDNKFGYYEDQLNNMQTSLLEKTSLADKLEQSCNEATSTAASHQELVDNLKKEIDQLRQGTEHLNASIVAKDDLLAVLNQSLTFRSDEMQELQKNLDLKQTMLSSIECKLMTMDEKMQELIENEKAATSRVQQTEYLLNRTNEKYLHLEGKQSAESESQKTNEKLLRDQIEQLNGVILAIQEESSSWQNKFIYLEKMIEPFREQLDSFEVERGFLLSKNSEAQDEVNKLSEEYAKLLGHKNHKQKIQHVNKLKMENNQLRDESQKLRADLERQRKAFRRLEEKCEQIEKQTRSKSETPRFRQKERIVSKENKENTPMDYSRINTTPLTSSNRMHRI